jgi:hypothetical protein
MAHPNCLASAVPQKLSRGRTLRGYFDKVPRGSPPQPVREGAEDEGETETGNEDCDKRGVRHLPIGFKLSRRLLSQGGMNPLNMIDRQAPAQSFIAGDGDTAGPQAASGRPRLVAS